jgi:MFS family permease
MIYPILPIYLSSVMGATPIIIGIIEGIAESLASIIKLFSGIIADKVGKKKLLAFIGYSSSILNKIAIIFSVTWTGILFARIIDRFGKGVRTAPRDALIAESAELNGLGKAYGLHKALDMLGAAIGILLAYFLINFEENSYRKLFLFSLVPAFIGVIIIFFIKDSTNKILNKKVKFQWKILDKRLQLFLVCIFIFTLGNSSNAFIILRAYSAGFTPSGIILLYFLYNIIASLLSFPIGKLSDKIGRKNTLCIGYFLYSIVYVGIGIFSNKLYFYGLFIIYGIYTALTAGGERALIVKIAPELQKASALGLHSAIVGMGLLPSSVIAGILWNNIGQSAPFIFGAIIAFFTSISMYVVLSIEKRKI